MCMKYINTTAVCYKSLQIENNQIVSFNGPFDAIKALNEDKGYATDDFVVVTQLDFIGTNNPEKVCENPLEQGEKLDFVIRLTKCSRSEGNRLCLDLDKFSIDLADMREKNQIEMACFGFLNYTRMTQIDKIRLPLGTGKYVIKVLVKKAQESDYQIQAMTGLSIL